MFHPMFKKYIVGDLRNLHKKTKKNIPPQINTKIVKILQSISCNIRYPYH